MHGEQLTSKDYVQNVGIPLKNKGTYSKNISHAVRFGGFGLREISQAVLKDLTMHRSRNPTQHS